MALPDSRNDRDMRSWEEDSLSPGDTRRKVTAIIDPSQYPLSTKSLTGDVEYDAIGASYPSSTVEVYSYYSGGLSGTLVATITVTYESSTKELITSVVRT